MLESLFIIKVHARGSATLLKETPTQVFSCEYCDIFKNSFLIEHLLWLLLSDEYLIDCSRSFWNEASSNYAGNKAILKKLYSKGKLHLNLALWSYLPNSSFYKTNDFWLNLIPLMKPVAQNMKNKLRTLDSQKT